MKKLTTGALLAMALLATACARNSDVTVPGGPGYGGSGTLGEGLGTGGMPGDGTLPGTSISDRVLFAVDQSTLSAEAIGTLNAADRLADPEPVRRRS